MNIMIMMMMMMMVVVVGDDDADADAYFILSFLFEPYSGLLSKT